jgi:hypothetical protein
LKGPHISFQFQEERMDVDSTSGAPEVEVVLRLFAVKDIDRAPGTANAAGVQRVHEWTSLLTPEAR